MPYKDENTRKLKHAEYSRNYYKKNHEKSITANNNYRKKKREEWQAFKCTLKCTVCGEDHPATLDFHHEDPSQKTGNVHTLAGAGQYKKAYEEIKKCIVLCANCHRIHHYEEKRVKIQPLKPTSNQICR